MTSNDKICHAVWLAHLFYIIGICAGTPSFFEHGREIPCLKGQPVDITYYIPNANLSLNICFKCDCPNGFIKCSRSDKTAKCDKAFNKLDFGDGRSANRSGHPAELNSTRVDVARSTDQVNTTINFGKTIFHLSGRLDSSQGEQQTDPSTRHFNQTAEALGWTQEKFELKRKELLKRLETNKSKVTNPTKSSEDKLVKKPNVQYYEQSVHHNMSSMTRLGCGEFRDQPKSNLITGWIDKTTVILAFPLQMGQPLNAHQLRI